MSKRGVIRDLVEKQPSTLDEIRAAVEKVYGPWTNRKATVVVQGLRDKIVYDGWHHLYVWRADYDRCPPLLKKSDIIDLAKDGITLELLLFVGGYANA